MTMGEGKDGVSNKLLSHDDSFHVVNQNSNILTTGKELEVKGAVTTLENVIDSLGGKEDGSRQLSTGSPNSPTKSNLAFSPKQNSFVLGQRLVKQKEAKPTCGVENEVGISESPKKKTNGKAFKESRSISEGMSNNGVCLNRKSEEKGRNKVEASQVQEEEDQKTQPFLEGLASEDEILQSRVERLARERKRRRQMERKMKKRLEIRRQKKKENRNRVSIGGALTKKGETCNS
ncbi:hypothetical protein SLA2020_129620 [Shorea laevis]